MSKRSLDDVFSNDPLGLLDVEIKQRSRHDTENHLINGFNEIQAFYELKGKAPDMSESQAIEELRLAKRLENFRNDAAVREKLSTYDKYKLLNASEINDSIDETPPASLDDILDSELLGDAGSDIFDMRHVSISDKTQSVNPYTANRKPCNDFKNFESLFKEVQSDLDNKRRETGEVEKISEIKAGQWFIVQGMLAYVAQMGERYEHRKGHYNARLRVIFSNKTESDLLLRSFGAALYKDKSARRVYGANDGPLFGGNIDVGQSAAGIVYVLKTHSQQNGIKEHYHYLHKIGVTSGSVKARIANAEKDATYLLAPVEVVGEFELYHMDVKATEKLLHKFFHSAQAEIEIKDRFGTTVRPREWFFVTIGAIKDAVTALQEGNILEYEYDLESGKVLLKH